RWCQASAMQAIISRQLRCGRHVVSLIFCEKRKRNNKQRIRHQRCGSTIRLDGMPLTPCRATCLRMVLMRCWSGLSIGSGQVEGACKNLVGRRLKQTGACWEVGRVNRMGVLCAILYGDQWKAYWKTAV
ncbi:MAG: hypothetical protein ACRC2T_06845, partial [Thermoguttaceae bacterium]